MIATRARIHYQVAV